MQPVLEAALHIEEAALVAPALHFLDARTVGTGDAEREMAEDFVGLPLLAEAELVAAAGFEIRQKLSINELGQRLFGSDIVCDGVIGFRRLRFDNRGGID